MQIPVAPGIPDIPPTRPHPGWIITTAIESLRTFIWALIPLLFSIRDRGALAMVAATVLFGLVMIAWRATEWRKIRYAAVDNTISLQSGVLGTSHKSVRPERIHAVDTIETPVHRLLGVSELRITTAGAGENLTIPAIGNTDAERLRRWIAVHRASTRPERESGDGNAVQESETPVVIRQMSPREVFVSGLTSGQIAPAAAIAAFGVRIVSEVLPESMVERIPWDPERLTPGGILALVFVGAIIAWGLSIAGAVLTNWNFTLARTPDSLIVTSGLLDRKQNVVAIRRIQGVSIVESLLRQPFGYASITIESAAAQHGSDDDAHVRQLFPFLKVADVSGLVREAVPEFAWIGEGVEFGRLPPRARRRYMMPVMRDFTLMTLLVCGIFAATSFGEWWFGLPVLLFLPPLLVHAERQFRDAGWWAGPGDKLAIRRRGIDRISTFTYGGRVQVRELSQSWFQRRAALGTIWLHTSSRTGSPTLSIKHLDYADGRVLLRALGPTSKQGLATRSSLPAMYFQGSAEEPV